MTLAPKQPFPLEEIHRHSARGIDLARRAHRIERAGMSHTVTTCGMS
jgi:hypothetical protein